MKRYYPYTNELEEVIQRNHFLSSIRSFLTGNANEGPLGKKVVEFTRVFWPFASTIGAFTPLVIVCYCLIYGVFNKTDILSLYYLCMMLYAGINYVTLLDFMNSNKCILITAKKGFPTQRNVLFIVAIAASWTFLGAYLNIMVFHQIIQQFDLKNIARYEIAIRWLVLVPFFVNKLTFFIFFINKKVEYGYKNLEIQKKWIRRKIIIERKQAARFKSRTGFLPKRRHDVDLTSKMNIRKMGLAILTMAALLTSSSPKPGYGFKKS